MYCYCFHSNPFIREAEAEFPGAEFIPASNSGYQVANRPKDYPITGIVIHTMQGTFDGTEDWFQNPQASVSAHYNIASDGRIVQMVKEKDIAYHAGNLDYNRHTIGIEHEGWVDESKWYTPELFESSAKVAGYLAKKYNIPIYYNRSPKGPEGIFGHEDIPGQEGRRFDPGEYFWWDHYIKQVEKYAGQ